MVSSEKAANIQALYRGGMTVEMLSRKLKMGKKTIRNIVAGIPSPHNDSQALFSRLGQMRRHGSIISNAAFSGVDENLSDV